MPNFLRRFSIYGDFWWRYVMFGARWCPRWLEPILVLGFTAVFFVVLGGARSSVASNLRVLLGCGWLSSQLRVFVVFWNYAWTLADEMHVKLGEDVISWEVQGISRLEELENEATGAIIMTAHMGNYDVAAPVFAPRFKQKIHMVRTPEREKESQDFQHGLRMKAGGFAIHYNEPGGMLGVELAKCLAEGDVVAIQGDRVLFDVSPVRLAYDQKASWQLPKGPFTLAMVTDAALYPIFVIRTGYRLYRIEAYTPIRLNRDREARKIALQEAAEQWSALLREVVTRNWSNWFVFEAVFTRSPDSKS